MAEAGDHGGRWHLGEPRALALSLAGKTLAVGGRGEAALRGSAAGNPSKWGED